MVITNVPIKNNAEIDSLTIKDFADAVMEKMNELLKNPVANTQTLIMYETLGFLKKQNPPIAFNEETQKALEERNWLHDNSTPSNSEGAE